MTAPKAETTTVRRAARRLGISDGAAYAAARNGELPVIRIGKRMLIPLAALNRLLEGSNTKSAG